MDSPFSLVVFASSQMTRLYPLRWLRVALCELLNADPELRVAALFIDAPAPKKAKSRARLVRKHGETKLQQYEAILARDAVEPEPEFDLEAVCQERGLPFFEMDLNSAEALAKVRELAPDLGVLFGCRILKGPIIDAPLHGTVNFHARDAERFRGGGSLGYWELLEQAEDIQITLHQAVAKVDAGGLLACSRLAIDACDTLESLLLKTVLRGLEFYAKSISDFARRRPAFVAQDSSRAQTYRRNIVDEAIFRDARRLVLRQMARYREGPLPSLWAPAPKPFGGSSSQLLVLSYARVANNDDHPDNLPFEVFYGQLQWLSKFAEIVSLTGAGSVFESPEPKRRVALVMALREQDLVVCLPFLRAYEIPITLLLGPEQWLDESMRLEDLEGPTGRARIDLGVSLREAGETALAPVFEARERAPVAVMAEPGRAPSERGALWLTEGQGAWLSGSSFAGQPIRCVPAPDSVTALAVLFE